MHYKKLSGSVFVHQKYKENEKVLKLKKDCSQLTYLLCLTIRFSVTVIQSERLIIAKLDGWPDLKTRLIPEDFTQAGATSR